MVCFVSVDGMIVWMLLCFEVLASNTPCPEIGSQRKIRTGWRRQKKMK